MFRLFPAEVDGDGIPVPGFQGASGGIFLLPVPVRILALHRQGDAFPVGKKAQLHGPGHQFLHYRVPVFVLVVVALY